MSHDCFDLPASTTSAAAQAAYDKAIGLLLTANVGADAAVRAALAADPDFALAHAAQARLHQLRAESLEARVAAARAVELAARASERECAHARILALAVNGQVGPALDAVRGHLAEYPRDALVVSLALGVYGLIAFSGRREHHREQRDLLESLAPHWPADGWFLGYLGWSQVETGEPERGAETIGQALALLPRNGHAVQALAHAHFERGNAGPGRAFLEAWLPGYPREAQLHCHLNWHLALWELDAGDPAAALRRYGEAIRPRRSQAAPMPTLADAASFLWRCRLYGATAEPLPWPEVVALAHEAFPQAGFAFADLHAAMAEAGSGDTAMAGRIAALEKLAAAGTLAAGAVVPTLCRGLMAFAAGDLDAAITHLEAAMPDLSRVGGSHAQRASCSRTR